MKWLHTLFLGYIVVLCGLFFYSFTQIDLSLTFSRIEFLRNLVSAFQYIGYFNRPLSTALYLLLVGLLFIFYLVFLHLAYTKKLSKKMIWKLLLSTTIILAFSYNAFSYDLFNYIFDAKIVTYYQQNPYEHKALDYAGDPMLSFMRWTHRVYPYGPIWLGITVPLSFLGFHFFIPTLLLFKSLMAAAFIGSLYYIGKIFQKITPEKENFGLIFFGLNPLVMIESLVSAHLDIVMIFFSLWSFYLLIKQKYLVSFVVLLMSIGIKFATVFLAPVYCWLLFLQKKKKKTPWRKIFLFTTGLMIITIILASLRTNFQPWYLVLVLAFAVFCSYNYYIVLPSTILSLTALFTYVPYLYVGNWDPPIPQMLAILYSISLVVSVLVVGIRFMIFKKMKKKIFFVLILLFSLHLGYQIISYKDSYLTRFDPKYWKERYLQSQWVAVPTCLRTDPHINPKTCKWDDNWHAQNEKGDKPLNEDKSIGDDGLYTYAGWEYITGHDPTLLNAEIPPLGKYLIGLSIVAFGNPNIFALLSGIFVLIGFFFLNRIIFKDNFLAFLPVFLLSFDPLFFTQLKATYLDLLYLGFLLLTFIFFLKKRFFFSAIFLGCMIATKASFSTFALVVITELVYLLYMKQKAQIKIFLFSLPVSMLVFIATYAAFFLQGNSFQKFFGVQKWIFNFYANGAKGEVFAPLQMIFTGQWSTWWGQLQYVNEWNILWPLTFIASFFYLYLVFSRRKKYESVLLGIWLVIYFIFLSFIPIWPRYLLVALPFMYNLAIWVFSKSIPLFLRRLA